jgi:hypothetical protein
MTAYNQKVYNMANNKSKYTKELLQKAVDNSTSYAGVLRYFGIKQSGGMQTHLSSRIKKFNINTDHFLGRRHNLGKHSPSRKTLKQILIRRPAGSTKEKTPTLRRALIESGREHICEHCQLGNEWNNKPLVLQIDHIDGDFLNNLSNNLRFLCPNCHTQTPTFGVSKRQTPLKEYNCKCCGSPISKRAFRCQSCAAVERESKIIKIGLTKIKWPDINSLIEQVNETSYVAVGKNLGVSDNAVRKHIKKHSTSVN